MATRATARAFREAASGVSIPYKTFLGRISSATLMFQTSLFGGRRYRTTLSFGLSAGAGSSGGLVPPKSGKYAPHLSNTRPVSRFLQSAARVSWGAADR